MEQDAEPTTTDDRTTRRRFLRALGGATAAGLGSAAGCIMVPVPSGPRGGGVGGAGAGSSGTFATGEADDRFYQSGPPERNGQVVTATDYGSLQAAHDVLSPGDTLRIPASGGPYQERLRISTDHITITSDGATIEQPDRSEGWVISSPSASHNTDTSLAAPVAGGGQASDGGTDETGDRVLQVADASPFSPGDDIHIHEAGRAYGEPSSGGASGPGETQEYRTVTGVDPANNTLEVHYPMFLPYPNENTTEVGRVEWAATDVHITGLHVTGIGRSGGDHLVELRNVKNAYLENLTLENAADGSMALTGCYQCRTDNIDMIDGGGYGITIRSGSTHTYCTNSVGDGIVNYTVRAGGSAVDVLADGVVGRNYTSSNEGPVAASHWGGFYIIYRNVQVEGEQLVRYRTRHMVVEDFDVSGSSTREIVWSQRPFHVIVRNGTIGNYPSGANEYIFHFRLRGDSQAGGGNRFGNEEGGNIRIEGVEIEQNGNHGPEDIGLFDSNAIIDGLYIRDVTYGGQSLTREHVEQWDGYSSANITNLVVE